MSATNFRLRVTAGPSYDRSTHTPVPVNTSEPLLISTPHSKTTLHIRLSSFKCTPSHPLPSTHPYFAHPAHAKEKDLYSFQLVFTPRTADINGADLVWGNDFDKPIRGLLPYGFGVFWNIAKWIDPGLDGDLYADKPWVWGSVLSSMNVIAVAPPAGTTTPQESEISDVEQTEMQMQAPAEAGGRWGGDTVLEEDMAAVAEPAGIPAAAGARKKFFLERARRERFTFQRGWAYGLDFFGPWLDFAGFEIRLPGYGLNLLKYWDGQPVRYTLRNTKTDEVYACVLLDFVEVGEDGVEKEIVK